MKAGLPSYTEDMKPVILHSDMNNFYASVEILYDPTLRDKPVAVAGDEEARHGIVLAKNDIAKRFGIRTGQVLWEARQQCPGLVCVPAHYERYLAFSARARDIYTSYTDQVESFGLDECWLDVTGSVELFGEGPTIADDIRDRIRRELGLTVSIGVSFNKVFAKLGSDMKKPDATTVITPENYRDKAWSLPVSDLLYVGPATTRKLNQYGITTIGELAQANPDLLYWLLGKNGIMLHQFANGQDHSGVRRYYAVPPMKSVGNSTTAPRDLVSEDDVKITLMALCESVGAIWETAMGLFRRHHTSREPVRSLSVKASGLTPADGVVQLSLFPEEQKAQRRADIDRALDKIRGKYGYHSIRRAITLVDPTLDLDAKGEHIIHPIGFLGTLQG